MVRDLADRRDGEARVPLTPRWDQWWLVLGAGLVGPALVMAASLEHWVTWSLPHTKLAMLAAYYAMLLPCAAAGIWNARKREQASGQERPVLKSRGWIAFALFGLILLPLAAGLGLGRYQGDESAYLFEARCLNAGSLTAVRPPGIPDTAFAYAHHLLEGVHWLGKYPPGWPLVLSVFTATHVEWLANPSLGLVLIWLTVVIGRTLFGDEQAWMAGLILASSSFMILNCLGYMSHVFSAVLSALAVLCVVVCAQSRNEPGSKRLRRAATVGFFASILVMELVRPFTAFCVGSALLLAWHLRLKGSAVRALALYGGVMSVLFVAVFCLQNYLLTGDPLRTAYSVYGGGQVREFSLALPDLVSSITHETPIRLVDTESVSFPFTLPLACFGLWVMRRNRVAWGIAGVFLSLVLGYIVERENSDSPIGERFYFEGGFALALLAGCGLVELGRQLALSTRQRQIVAGVLAMASLCMVAICSAWEYELRTPSKQMAEAMRRAPFTRGVVFVHGTDMFPAFNWNFNDPRSGILEMIDPGPGKREEYARLAHAEHWVDLHYDPLRERPVWGPVDQD